jgi:Protein of unknown function (DUF3300)
VFAQEPTPTPAPAQEAAPAQETPDAPKIPNDQLDALVAPIALYPDPLLSQVLVASTYPLELVQLQQWLDKTGGFMNEKAIAEGVLKEDWDPSIQAMAALPAGRLPRHRCEDFYRQPRRHRLREGPWARLPEYRQED